MSFWIPGRLPGLNELMLSRETRIVDKGRHCASIEHLIRSKGVPTFWQGAHIWLHCVEPSAKRDPGNFCGGAEKLVSDALQHAEVLRTDSWTGVLGLRYTWDLDKSAPGVLVTLSETELPWIAIPAPERGATP